jgi:AcrR family transcriptional regulator
MKSQFTKTEKKIFDAAIEVFSEKGFSGASTSEIAKRAEVSEGSIFKYFKTKKGLLLSIMGFMVKVFDFNQLIEPVNKILKNAENVGLKDTLRLLFKDRILLVEQHFPMIKMLVTEALYQDELREVLLENGFEKVKTVVESFCISAVSNGLIRKDITPEMLMRIVIGNLGALIIQRNLLSKKITLKSLDEEINDTVDLILNGVLP